MPDNPARPPLPVPATLPPPLLLTRPAEASARFAALWRARMGPEAPVVVAPVTEIAILPAPDPAPGTVLVFTSENAVRAVAPVAGQDGRQDGHRARAWCVGARTAEAALQAGFAARDGGGTADDLVAAILASGDPGPFLHARGRQARGDVAARLAGAGLSATEAVVYDQRPLPLSDEALALLAGNGPVLVPLFSAASAVRLAAAMAGHGVRARLRIAAMAPAVAWTGPAPERLALAARPEAAAMLAALAELARDPAVP